MIYSSQVTSTADDSDKETEKFLTVLADKRIPLSQFKAELEALLNVPAEFLLVYKKTTSTAASSFGGMEREWCQQHETLETLGDDPQVQIDEHTYLKKIIPHLQSIEGGGSFGSSITPGRSSRKNLPAFDKRRDREVQVPVRMGFGSRRPCGGHET